MEEFSIFKKALVLIHFFKNINNELIQVESVTDNVWINAVPPFSRGELQALSEQIAIPADFLTDALDIDEKARFEQDDNVKLIVIKAPVLNSNAAPNIPLEISCITIPICIILTKDNIVTINSFDNRAITNFLNTMNARCIENRNTMVLKILDKVVRTFLIFLREINYKRNELEQQLYISSSNEVLLQLMEIQKSLVYMVTALRSNELLMMKLERTNFLQLKDEEREELEDIIVDTNQAVEMANIYANILSSTLDAFASIISNNQNQVLKKLTLVTIILQFPVLISSIYGMNVPIPYQDSPYAFYVPVAISVFLSVFICVMFMRKRNF